MQMCLGFLSTQKHHGYMLCQTRSTCTCQCRSENANHIPNCNQCSRRHHSTYRTRSNYSDSLISWTQNYNDLFRSITTGHDNECIIYHFNYSDTVFSRSTSAYCILSYYQRSAAIVNWSWSATTAAWYWELSTSTRCFLGGRPGPRFGHFLGTSGLENGHTTQA